MSKEKFFNVKFLSQNYEQLHSSLYVFIYCYIYLYIVLYIFYGWFSGQTLCHHFINIELFSFFQVLPNLLNFQWKWTPFSPHMFFETLSLEIADTKISLFLFILWTKIIPATSVNKVSLAGTSSLLSVWIVSPINLRAEKTGYWPFQRQRCISKKWFHSQTLASSIKKKSKFLNLISFIS